MVALPETYWKQTLSMLLHPVACIQVPLLREARLWVI